MKRILLSVAILAVAASCSKNEVIDIPQTNAIGFSTINDRVTKAANDSKSPYTVFSDANVTTDTDWFITELAVETGTSSDSANATYFWPLSKDETVNFYAYAPNGNPGNISYDKPNFATPTLPIIFTVPAAADVDFTIATPVTGAYCVKGADGAANDAGANEDGVVSAAGQVSLQFSHMLSKAVVNVTLDEILDENHVMTFDNITIVTANNKVTADVVKGPKTGAASVAGAFTCTYTIDEAVAGATDDAGDETIDNNYDGTQAIMFAPQTDASFKVTINNLIVYNKNTGLKVYTGSPVYENTALTFAQGTAYNVNVEISDEDLKDGRIAITFASDDDDWNKASADVDVTTIAAPAVKN